MLICLSMDKWALRGHFYSYVDLVRLLYNIRSCCHVIAQVVFWAELPVQRRLCQFSLNLGSRKKKGTQWCGVGLPDIHESFARDPWDLGRHTQSNSLDGSIPFNSMYL